MGIHERNIDVVTDLIRIIGDDPNRPGLKETPDRVLRSFKELFSGYTDDPKKYLKIFQESSSDEMILIKSIGVNSFCEHHLLPFVGIAHVAYIPSGNRVLGLSKIARIVNSFSRRLQIQERLTYEIASFLYTNLECFGVGVVIEAKHHCMCMRGARDPNSFMHTSCLLGHFRDRPDVKSEFLSLIQNPLS